MIEKHDLDTQARQVVLSWNVDGDPIRVDRGVNKATWRVGDFWLSSDFTSARDQVGRLAALLSVVAAEFGGDIEVPRFVSSADGPIVVAHGRAWWMTRHIDGRHPDPAVPSDMAAVASGLALMHRRLSRVPREYAVSSETCEGLFRLGEKLVNDDRLRFAPDDLTIAREAAAVVAARLESLRRPGLQMTHGDPSNPNLFVTGSPLRLTGAIDWDYARYDLLVSDIATMAQTILFRSGTDRPREYLQEVMAAYVAAGGLEMSLDDVLTGVLMVVFEAIAHHGTRYIRGEGAYVHVGGRVDDIRTVLDLRTG